MRTSLLVVAVVVSFGVMGSPALAQEQPSLSSAEIATGCAPPVADTQAAHDLRIIGAQTLSSRSTFDNRDLLIVNAGTEAGVQLGARFYIRRPLQFGSGRLIGAPVEVVTDGWIRIVAANEDTAIASVEYSCGAIFQDDYLEPFTPPDMPEGRDDAGEPDFDSPARVVSGSSGHDTIVPGEFIIIDQGSAQDVQPGARFEIYRDTVNTGRFLSASKGTPLMSVGQAIVVSASGSQARARVLQSREAVRIGDYAVFRR